MFTKDETNNNFKKRKARLHQLNVGEGDLHPEPILWQAAAEGAPLLLDPPQQTLR